MNRMNKEICKICQRPMGNSANTELIQTLKGMLRISVHKKCEKGLCLNCLSMIFRNINGECICGNIITYTEEGVVEVVKRIK